MKGNKTDAIPWIAKADHDLGTAMITFLHIPDFYDTVTFHCQQAVEKYLKSLLVFFDIDFKPTHDLVYLQELIRTHDPSIEDYYEKILKLQNYAVEVRYPDETIFLSHDKVMEAITTAKLIRNLVVNKMVVIIDYNPIIDSELPK